MCRNTFTFKPGQLIDIEPQWMLDKAIPRSDGDTHRKNEPNNQQTNQLTELATYGQRLHTFLFGNGADFNAFLRYNDSYKRARITLAMHQNAAALWRLPWEYLHDGDDFLALSGRFQLSRRPHGMATFPAKPVQLPLRILVVIASPDDAKLLDTEEEIGVIQEALDEAQQARRVQVQYLDDATLSNIGDSLRDFNPHVLHYTGHGAFDKKTDRSYLLLENDDGESRPADIKALQPHLARADELRLVVLSGCQTAQTSDADAFSGVATGMLAADMPAVVAMQFSILDNSAIQWARAFYAALARGESLVETMAAARLALRDYEDGPGFDWGVPALYLRVPEMRLVDPDAVGSRRALTLQEVATLINVEGLLAPHYFVGRKPELRKMRRALKQRHVNSIFVRGIGGIGKSSIAAKLIERPGVKLDGVLVIRCHKVDPLDIPVKIAGFLIGQGEPGHADAGKLLLHAPADPAARARQAAQLISGRRYLFVFDNFERL
ncbi:MAG: CHAT domain-containing protein [Anaerolineales bacterium]|nr:CHAT domain-containing protein [Anaerolineales bacterium]